MPTLTEVAARDVQHVMVFGDSGTGKSTLVSKLAEAGYNLIWLSIDNGHSVLYKLSEDAKQRINIIVMPDTREFPVAIDTVRKLMKLQACDICHEHGAVACPMCKRAGGVFSKYDFGNLPADTIVVIDHGTALTDSCMSLVCKGKAVDYKPQRDDWGSLSFNMTELMKLVQVAPFNLVMIAQVMEAELEDGKKRLTPAVGSREFGRTVAQYFDHMVYCDIINKAHKFGSSTTFSTTAIAKSRTDVAIEKMEVPALAEIFSAKKAIVETKQVAAKTLLSASQLLKK